MQTDPSDADQPGPDPGTPGRMDPLSVEWPWFLDLLNSPDPERVFEPLHEFVTRLLIASPPSIFRALKPQEREEMPGKLLLRLSEDDFRRLRSYRPRGVPFSHWVLTVARNMARTLNDQRKSRRVAMDNAEFEGGPPAGRSSNWAPPDREVFFRRHLDRVVAIIRRMDKQCQLLLIGAANGLRPKELTRLLGWPASANKRASDALRHCRYNLRSRLREEGMDPDEAP